MSGKTIGERFEAWRGAFKAAEADEGVEHGERMRLVHEGAALARELAGGDGGDGDDGAGEREGELEGLAADFAASHGEGRLAAARKLAEAAGKAPAGEPDRPLPDDVRQAIAAFIEDWQSASDDHERARLVELAGQIAKGLKADGIPDEAGEGLAAIERAVAVGAEAPGAWAAWESIPEAPSRSQPASRIKRGFPAAILGVAGVVPNSDPEDPREWTGALISEGTVAVLSGEGSVAKSGLTCDLAVGIASCADGFMDVESQTLHPLPGKLFRAQGGPVLMVTYEDPVSVTAFKLQGVQSKRSIKEEALARVHVLDMEGAPLFGPPAPEPIKDDAGNVTGESRAGLYNQRPEPLAGWRAMWGEVERLRPVLVIIDPALAAYVGDASGVAPVREFLVALTLEARKFGCGVLIVAHSTKAARSEPDPLDPGNVSGSAAWFDGVRGVAVMHFAPDGDPDVGLRTLALPKVNYGHGRIGCTIKPVRLHSGAIVGFDLAESDPWHHLTNTKRGEQEVRKDGDGKGKERPYSHEGAVIDAVRVMAGKPVGQAKQDAIQPAARAEAVELMKRAEGDGAAAEKAARRRYGKAKQREAERNEREVYAEAMGGEYEGGGDDGDDDGIF